MITIQVVERADFLACQCWNECICPRKGVTIITIAGRKFEHTSATKGEAEIVAARLEEYFEYDYTRNDVRRIP